MESDIPARAVFCSLLCKTESATEIYFELSAGGFNAKIKLVKEASDRVLE
jgi:hypothetical protein